MKIILWVYISLSRVYQCACVCRKPVQSVRGPEKIDFITRPPPSLSLSHTHTRTHTHLFTSTLNSLQNVFSCICTPHAVLPSTDMTPRAPCHTAPTAPKYLPNSYSVQNDSEIVVLNMHCTYTYRLVKPCANHVIHCNPVRARYTYGTTLNINNTTTAPINFIHHLIDV